MDILNQGKLYVRSLQRDIDEEDMEYSTPGPTVRTTNVEYLIIVLAQFCIAHKVQV